MTGRGGGEGDGERETGRKEREIVEWGERKLGMFSNRDIQRHLQPAGLCKQEVFHRLVRHGNTPVTMAKS